MVVPGQFLTAYKMSGRNICKENKLISRSSEPWITAFDVDLDRVRLRREALRRRFITEDVLIDQIVMGRLSRASSRSNRSGLSKQTCAKTYPVAHDVTRNQGVGEEQVTVGPEKAVASAGVA